MQTTCAILPLQFSKDTSEIGVTIRWIRQILSWLTGLGRMFHIRHNYHRSWQGCWSCSFSSSSSRSCGSPSRPSGRPRCSRWRCPPRLGAVRCLPPLGCRPSGSLLRGWRHGGRPPGDWFFTRSVMPLVVVAGGIFSSTIYPGGCDWRWWRWWRCRLCAVLLDGTIWYQSQFTI